MTRERRVQRYGWIADIPDQRDLVFRGPKRVVEELPPSADLRPDCPPVYDQGKLGSCTANAIGAAMEYDLMRQGLDPKTPSRLFIYYNERLIEGTVRVDAGAMIRDGIKSVNKQGACAEENWPYDIARFSRKPGKSCYAKARSCRVTKYERILTLDDMKACLAGGYPFTFGFSVYESFESEEVARTGVVNMPSLRERQIGGHAVLAVGYDDAAERFTVRNSWSGDWGQDGYFTMPYDYLTDRDLSDDMWKIETVSGEMRAGK